MRRHPNRVTTFSNRNHTSISMVQSLTDVSFVHHVKYFVAVIMYLAHDLLSCGLIGPKNSMAHLSNAFNVTYGFKGISSLLMDFPLFDIHHMTNSSLYCLYEVWATKVLCTKKFVQFLCLHNVLLQYLCALL
jgi:hypothetical protein